MDTHTAATKPSPVTRPTVVSTAKRPSTYDDLETYQREGHLIASIYAVRLLAHPAVAMHLLSALKQAEVDGLLVVDGAIRVERTDAELDKALDGAQRLWDSRRDWYVQAFDDPASANLTMKDYQRTSVDLFATENDLEPVNWLGRPS